MEVEKFIDELWEEHIERTATVQCNAESPSRRRLAAPSAASRTTRHSETSHSQFRSGQRALKSPAIRSAASETVGGTADDADASKLTLTNMGGVFLLHGLFSAVSFICAFIPWVRKRYIDKRPNDSSVREFSSAKPFLAPSTDAMGKTNHVESDSQERDAEVVSRPNDETTRTPRSSFAYAGDDEGQTSDSIEALRKEMHLKLLSIEQQLANPALDNKLRRIEDKLMEVLEKL